MAWFFAAHDGFSKLAFRIACLALVVLLGAYLVEVVARYGFNAPTRWTSDLVQYMLCVSTSLALPWVTREGGHVAITSFLEKMSAARQAFAARCIQGLGALTLSSVAIVFVLVGWDQFRQGIETVAAFAIPKWWLSGLVVLGSSSAALHLLRQAVGVDDAQAGHEMDV
jgi:C4-dicarboxylate transporter, DctQ subunit